MIDRRRNFYVSDELRQGQRMKRMSIYIRGSEDQRWVHKASDLRVHTVDGDRLADRLVHFI
jgi:hypothetical protein